MAHLCTELLFLDTVRVMSVVPDVAVVPAKYVINCQLHLVFGIVRCLLIVLFF